MAKLSKPGAYRGYSEKVADGYERSSQYVRGSDGCQLAVDVLLQYRGVRLAFEQAISRRQAVPKRDDPRPRGRRRRILGWRSCRRGA